MERGRSCKKKMGLEHKFCGSGRAAGDTCASPQLPRMCGHTQPALPCVCSLVSNNSVGLHGSIKGKTSIIPLPYLWYLIRHLLFSWVHAFCLQIWAEHHLKEHLGTQIGEDFSLTGKHNNTV